MRLLVRPSLPPRHSVVPRMAELFNGLACRFGVTLLSLAAAVFMLSQTSLAQPTQEMVRQTAHLSAFGGYILPSAHGIGNEDLSAAVRVQYGDVGYTVRMITPISAFWAEARDAPNLAQQLAALPKALRERSPCARPAARFIPIRPTMLLPVLV